MRSIVRSPAWLLLAAGALPCLAQAQSFSANYDLTRPAMAASASTDSDLVPRGRPLSLGAFRVSPAFNTASTGAGLSLEAGQQWFGRLTVGRSVELDSVALGGGYRWRDGQSVSMQLSRGRGHERLGLAVRYDWPRYFVRVGYDPRQGEGTSEMLRFSAGMRF